jgi:tRNA modification GTPase
LAHLEAAIDFVDEELPSDLSSKQTGEIHALANEIAGHLNDRHRGERLREGFSIAILGPPNAGKSSLLNALAQRDAAIVSSTAGTTRDVIEVHLDLGGWPIILADTAGLQDSAEEIESEGIRRALGRAEKADLKVLVFDGSFWPVLDEATRQLIDDRAVVVVNKSDLIGNRRSAGKDEISEPVNSRLPNTDCQSPVFLSAKTGEGISDLFDRLIGEIDLRFADAGSPPLTRQRHRAALEECQSHLSRALEATETELRAEDVRLALRALGRITGRVDVEDLLDVIFRDFCVGK